ncbi:hypothetical protein Cgig2_009637 [Carnegiea gigantea]|uniref:Uncharacterized protein n=1 Tax=Carnegiea gigantea TaxID=171969 RepID=A0A9Q1JTM9_9CARY|nr:hypothetical protein Cgig2_009637 [Carnegiea gigantea]
MSEFVIHRFLWDRRGKAFPTSPLPKDFRSLCPDFDLATTEQAAAHYELPELSQAIFYAMLLNEAEKLGMLHGPRLRSLEVALTKLCWEAFESWIWLSASHPPRPLPEDFNVLCPYFSLAEAEDEAAAAESELPKIVQATFYAILLNEMLELGVVHEYTTERMRSLLVGLRWSTFEVWMRIMDEVIQGEQLHRQPDEVEVKGARDGRGRVRDQPILLPLRATRSRLSFCFATLALSCFPF